MKQGRRRLWPVATAAVGMLLAVTASSAFVGASDAATPTSYRDASGLLVISASRDQEVPEAQRDAWAAYDALTEAYPADLGYASPNLVDGTVTVGVATDEGATALATFSAGSVPAPTTATTTADSAPVTVSAENLSSSGLDYYEAYQATSENAKESKSKKRANLGAAATAAKGAKSNGKPGVATRGATEYIKDALIGWATRSDLKDADLWSTEVERSTGSVIMRTARLTPALASAVVSRWGTEQVVVIIEPNPQLSVDATRLNDVPSFWGGSRINVPKGQCTSGFSWQLGGGVSGMVTAGHCAPDGGSVSTPATYMGSVQSTYYENYRGGTGTVTVPGYTGYHGDGAIVSVASGKYSAPAIYRGGTGSSTGSNVMSMFPRRAARGDLFCTGGSFSGEVCGWGIYAVQVNLTVNNHGVTEIVRNVVRGQKQDWCQRPGDSGAPVYYFTSGGVTAKGINNGGGGGGGDYFGGTFDPCDEYHTDIWDIYYGLPGYLKTT